MDKLIVIIPAFNEEKSVGNVLKNINTVLNKSIFKKKFRIILINDGSTDNTHRVAKNHGNTDIVSHKINKGLGAAVKTGLNICKKLNAKYVVKIDADGQHNASDILNLVKPLVDDKADVVYGRRILNFRTSLVRKFGNIFFSNLMRILTSWDIQDSQPGIFAINNESLRGIKIFGNYNYTQQVLLSCQLTGMRFMHIDVSFSKRNTGGSFVSLSYIYKALSQILVLLICFQPLKVFGRLGVFLLLLGFLIFSYQSVSWLLGFSDRVIDNVNLLLGISVVGGQSLLAGLLGQLIVNLNEDKKIERALEISDIKFDD